MRPSLSRAITRACTSEPRLSLTITAHPVVAVVVMVVAPRTSVPSRSRAVLPGPKGCILVARHDKSAARP